MLNNFELDILRFFRKISTSFTDAILEFITIFGEQIIIVAILAFFYFAYNKNLGKKIAYTLFTSLSLNGAIKGVVSRPRPFVLDPLLSAERVETATGFSFPSGHTQASSTFFYTTAFYFKKKLLWIFCIVITILIGFSRIGLGVHYPTDVIVGMILGILCAIFLSILFDKCIKNFKSELLMYLASFIIFVPFIFIFYSNNYNKVLIHKDFYQMVMMFGGFICAFIIDEKLVQFDTNVSLKTKILRLIGAGISYVLVDYGLKFIFPKDLFILSLVRYFLITFVVLGIYPLIFKNILFKKQKKE